MRVRDVMTVNPVTVQPSDTLQTAQERMTTVHCRRLPVVDEQGHLQGIITDRDLRLAANSPLILRERWQDELIYQHTLVDTCMAANPITVTPDTPLEDAIDLLLEHNISGLPVLEQERLAGVITVTDLLRTLGTLLRDSREPQEN